MAINFWHRKPGFFDGEYGVYYRYPYNPDFSQDARAAIPGICYRGEWRAFWVPEGSSLEFERFAMDRGIGTPCPRCRRGEYCKAWPEVVPGQPDFEKQTEEWFKSYEEFWQTLGRRAEQKDRTASWGEKAPKQETYGRRVDEKWEKPSEDWWTKRETRHVPPKEPPIQQPLDARRGAANLLGVALDADESTIKQAARQLALVHHPDRGGDVEKMAEVLAARDLLLGRRSRRSRW